MLVNRKINSIALLIFVTILIAPWFTAACAKPYSIKPVILGCPLSLGFPDGIAARDNIQLAVEEINQDGGVNIGGVKRPLIAEFMDTRDLEPGVPTSEALLAVEKLLLEKKADLIIGGPVRSEAALAAMDLVSKYQKVSLISAGVLTPAYDKKITDDYERYKYCFRTTGSVDPMISESVSILERMKVDFGWSRVHIMVQDVAHARSAGDAMKAGLEERGWKITGYEKYPTGSSDFSLGLLKAKEAGAQVLFPWFDMPESSILMKQWNGLKLPMLICGYLNAALDSGFWKATDGKCAYIVVVYPKAGVVSSGAIPQADKYINVYKKKFGSEPGLTGWSPVCYQVVYIVKEALERAGSVDSGALIAALEKLDMRGVYGRIRFNPRSHQIIYSMDPAEGAVGCWTQWLDGRRVLVYPPKIATAPIKLPPWMK